MESRSQASLEALLYLLAFLAFILVLARVQGQIDFGVLQVQEPDLGCFGKSRSTDANFTRWFR